MLTTRLRRRICRHHLPLGCFTIAAAGILYGTREYPDVITRLSFASAYPALGLIAVTLLIGPLTLVSGQRMAVSIDLRRDIGIWAGMVSVFHAAIGQCVHLRGRPWLYYIYENWQRKHFLPFRHDVFGFANYTGLAAALIVFALLITSNDASLRKFGTDRWKHLQRLNYYAFGLTGAHTFGYQIGVESPKFFWIAAAAVFILVTACVQGVGLRYRKAVALPSAERAGK